MRAEITGVVLEDVKPTQRAVAGFEGSRMLLRKTLPAFFVVGLCVSTTLHSEVVRGGTDNKNPQEIAWRVLVSPAYLSYRQRMQADIQIVIPIHDVSSYDSPPSFELVATLHDHATRTVLASSRTVVETTLAMPRRHQVRIANGTELNLKLSALLIPGDYDVEVRLRDHANQKSASYSGRLSVPRLSRDPFADLWANLPTAEFLQWDETHTYQYLRRESSSRALQLQTARRIRVEILVNCCVPSSVLATLEVVSQFGLPRGSFSLRVIDLIDRKIIFEQHEFTEIDGEGFLKALQSAKPTSNANDMPPSREHHVDLFHEVLSSVISSQSSKSDDTRFEADGEAFRILIVISRPTPANQTFSTPVICNSRCPSRTLYLRHIGEPDLGIAQIVDPNSIHYDPVNTLGLPRGNSVDTHDEVWDGLPEIMRNLNPRVIRVGTPMEMRRALRQVADEIRKVAN